MPLTRDLVAMTNYEDIVHDLISQGHSPSDIVEKLKADENFMAKVTKFGYTSVTLRDVHNFMSAELSRYRVQDEGKLAVLPTASHLMSKTKERVEAAMRLFEAWETLAGTGMKILEEDMKAYVEEKEAVRKHNENLAWDDKGRRREPSFPDRTFETNRKAVLACIEGIRMIRGDTQLQALVKAQSVVVNQGMSQDEFHDLVLNFLAPELGITKARMLEVLTKALIAKKKRSTAINAQARVEEEGEKWKSRLPFVESLGKTTFFKEHAPEPTQA